MPSVTWRHPTGAIIRANDSSYSLINNQTGVMLRFRVTYMDLGAWVCILRSEEPDSRRQGGKVFVGEANITIQLSLPCECSARQFCFCLITYCHFLLSGGRCL